MAGAVKAAVEGAAIDTVGGGPEDPVADGAALANAARVARQGSYAGSAQAAFNKLPSGGHEGGLGVGVRLVWAVAAAILVLEVLSLATGRYWSWSLKGGLSSLQNVGSYLGLYPGQTAKLAAPPAQNPLVFTGTTASPNVNLSGRAGGNVALG